MGSRIWMGYRHLRIAGIVELCCHVGCFYSSFYHFCLKCEVIDIQNIVLNYVRLNK